MQTNFLAQAATIFSRVSAPPPPLIMAMWRVISSAPSTYTSISPASLRSITRMPCFFRRSAVATDEATAASMRPLMWASSSMKKLAVEPVPTPMMPAGTYSMAARAVACFISSWVIMMRFVLLGFVVWGQAARIAAFLHLFKP